MGSLNMSDERIAGVERSRAWVEVEVEAEVEVEVEERTYLRLPKQRWRVELLVRTILEKGGAKMRMDFEVWRRGMQPNFEKNNLKKIFWWRHGGQEDRRSRGGKFWREKNPEKAKKDGAEIVPDGESCGGK